GIVIAKSIDGGQTFSTPVDVFTFPAACLATPTGTGCPIDQGLSAATPFGGSFRSNTYPTLTVDDTGRVYVAWSQRQVNGDARIVMSVSADGVSWPSAGTPVDLGLVPDDLGAPFPNLSNPSRGHQLMPSLSFNAGKLMLAYYDLRQDHTLGIFTAAADEKSYLESRQLLGELDPTSASFNPDAVFNPFITDGPQTPTTTLTVRRHTIDMEGAQSSPMPAGSLVIPSFTSFRISRYQFGINPFDSTSVLEQLQVNTPNLPLFVQGTQPFIGDYIDVAGAPPFVFSNGKWNFNTAATSNPVFHAVWTDNRDVRPPADGNWTSYTPPFSTSNLTGPHPSVFDPTQTVAGCTDDSHTGMRNQNIYTSRVAPGIYVAAPGNSKTLGFIPNTTTLLQRMFALTVLNTTTQERSFRITIANQPLLADGVTVDPAGSASLQQFGPLQTTEDVTISGQAGVSRPIFAQSANPTASVTVNVQEITAPGGTLVSGGLQASTTLNPDPTAPQIIDPETPTILNPTILNAEVYNPTILNPTILNPTILNPTILNPAVSAALNPTILNPTILNPTILNPTILNPALADQTVTDTTYTIANTGNTVGSYAVKLFGTQPAGTTLQLILTKTYLTPISQNCQLASQSQNTTQVSVPNPVIEGAATLGDPELPNSSTKNATINLRPGETALVTLRANVSSIADAQNIVNNLTPVVVSHAANTGATTPPATLVITTTNATLNAGVVGVGYTTTLASFGGNSPVSWSVFSGSLPPGLTLDPATGIISGSPTAAGTFSFTLELTDSSTPTPTFAFRNLSITIAVPLVIGTTSLNDGVIGAAYSQTLSASGGNSTFTWTLASGSLPAGLQLSAAGVIGGTPTGPAATASFIVQVQDSGTPQQTKTLALTIRIAAPLALSAGTLPPAKLGVAYNQPLSATGGTAPLTWSLGSGSVLPPGLGLNSAGSVSGIPTALGTFSFSLVATDSATPHQSASANFSITVANAYT
ncbi:MAG TPA: putative Ig domain-containing protein, partial [Candidatus Angelobacter sp.]|nr:putative Ig domain-containing protein [Candidatus Angelobacter sp.]